MILILRSFLLMVRGVPRIITLIAHTNGTTKAPDDVSASVCLPVHVCLS